MWRGQKSNDKTNYIMTKFSTQIINILPLVRMIKSLNCILVLLIVRKRKGTGGFSNQLLLHYKSTIQRLIHIQRHSYYWITKSHALQHRIPTTVTQKSTNARMTRNSLLWSPFLDYQSPFSNHIKETLRQCFFCTNFLSLSKP